MRDSSGLHSPAPNRVPAITLHFWIIKVLCTTVGETAADFVNEDLELGLLGTTVIMTSLFVLALLLQFRARRYVPWIYWLVLVLISVVGTLLTDNFTEHLGVPLALSTFGFGAALLATFAAWYVNEGTLSIRTIVNLRREAFYWLVVLLTFALGTAAGDWLAEGLELGYLASALTFGVAICTVALLYRLLPLASVACFWTAYVLTRPLGASLGDYLAQSQDNGGLALGTSVTSVLFLGAILAAVIYVTLTKRDVVATS